VGQKVKSEIPILTNGRRFGFTKIPKSIPISNKKTPRMKAIVVKDKKI